MLTPTFNCKLKRHNAKKAFLPPSTPCRCRRKMTRVQSDGLDRLKAVEFHGFAHTLNALMHRFHHLHCKGAKSRPPQPQLTSHGPTATDALLPPPTYAAAAAAHRCRHPPTLVPSPAAAFLHRRPSLSPSTDAAAYR
ncbi:hypothetical protein H257_18572 [Aphanomyces astaci]|uniref:Uncharacterized protein n=1 Tax=Aphanomyces astaci TaxID=112090 RepID=W4FCY5_APHAT|nr:hypothetical protein H257_18572 [Aphanomyces astaci]ETV64553.1 hypothetical protein H257_18572 [Aphanomyces astaci]|eukprot:XP_009845967.1 hypothetical protein H257_18572 [Aphanomyces astaci]